MRYDPGVTPARIVIAGVLLVVFLVGYFFLLRRARARGEVRKIEERIRELETAGASEEPEAPTDPEHPDPAYQAKRQRFDEYVALSEQHQATDVDAQREQRQRDWLILFVGFGLLYGLGAMTFLFTFADEEKRLDDVTSAVVVNSDLGVAQSLYLWDLDGDGDAEYVAVSQGSAPITLVAVADESPSNWPGILVSLIGALALIGAAVIALFKPD